MDGFLRALGFDSKPDYAEKIPETLKASDFSVHETFHHGFPSQPTVLDYDPLLQLLAIGTETGAILLLGKPGLERYFMHPSPTGITMMRFIVNKGFLVTLCDNGTLYLWSIKEQVPCVIHTLEFVKENDRPSCISSHYKSEWLYVGSENGNIYMVNIPSFKVSGYTIYWNHITGQLIRSNPGRVLCVMEHPMDQGKIFIAYTGGHCVLYNLKQHESTYNLSMSMDSRMAPDHKYFLYDPGDNHIITSVDWVNFGRQVACSYSDGSIVLWNTKAEAKPEKIFTLHDCDPTQFRPIYKMQVVQTESDALYLCSGGFPEKSTEAPRTMTIMQGKSISMLTTSSTIIDFLSLSSSPYLSDCQKPFALVILAKNEMIIHDMTTPGYPKFPSYSLPYALDIHLPAVTNIFYSANCPEEFIAQLHSVKSKMMAPSTKPWPLHGGKWGEEVPHSTTDIIVTGHTDGSVRLWHCSSVVFQPFFTIDTSRYFKQRANQSPSKSRLGGAKQSSTPSSRPPPPSHPPPKPKKSPSTASETPIVVEEAVEVGTEEKEGEETGSKQELSSSDRTTPDHLQQPSESTDGSSADKSPEVVQRRTISYNDKKSRRKKKTQSLEVFTPDTPGVQEHEKRTLKLKSFRKMAKLVKTSQSVSIRNSIAEEDTDGMDEVFEEEKEEESKKDGDSSSGGDNKHSSSTKSPPRRPPPSNIVSPVSPMADGDQLKPRKKRPPPRPSNISIRQQETQQQLSTGVTPGSVTFALGGENSKPSKRNKRPVPQPNVQEDSSARSSRSTPPHDVNHSPCRLTTRSQFSRAYLEADNEFFVINYIHMCLCGLWLCVANEGGKVLAFDFTTTPKDHSTGVLDVNFDYDSVKKQYVSLPPTAPGEISSPLQAPPNIADWIYNEQINDSSSGYQLTQLCHCFSTLSPSLAPTPSSGASEQQPSADSVAATPVTPAAGFEDRQKVPATVSAIQYSTDLRMLVIGTRRGFAIVDTKNNSCVYILSSCTSILYLSDPSKFTSQMKKESKQPGVAAHPSIRRHGTIIRFSDTKRQSSMSLKATGGVAGGRTTSHPTLPVKAGSRASLGSVSTPMDDREEGWTTEVSVELDSCVSCVELVQLQLDKTSSPTPTLTLWVGLAAGQVASYVVNIPKSGSKRVELHPTRLICETKTPIVKLFFLNEYGDCQVVPYRPNNSLSVGGRRELLNSPQLGRKNKSTSPSTAPLHYAVVVDEQKLRSFSFPGFSKINFVNPPIVEGNVILRSEFFTCNALPCLATITSCQKLLIHTLPGLKLMVSHVFSPLGDPLATGTFRASGNGLGLYMPSPSEIQRMSIVRNDMLNYPACLPSVFTERSDVSPSSYGKGFLGMLGITGTPTAINREDLFGKSAARAIGNLVRLDGQIVRAYGNKDLRPHRQRDDHDGQSPAGEEKSGYRSTTSTRRNERGSGGGGAGLSNQMNRNLVSLDERKKKLTAIEDRTARVADSAASYADLCTQLAQKHRHDRK